jgi:diphthamide biosynthesis methyltransferase
MTSVSSIVKQLKKERDLVSKQLEGLNAALSAFVGVYTGAKSPGKRRKLSAAARAKIASAQRKRWEKIKGTKAKSRKKGKS